jgi:esterase
MKLHFHRQGQTNSPHSPVILLHGLFGSFENLSSIAKALYHNFDVICVDMPNHGRSEHSDDFNYNQMTLALLSLMDELQINRFSLLGHSMGGKAAMQLAINHPQMIDKLIVADMAPVAYQPQHNQVIKALQSVNLSQLSNRKAADNIMQSLISEAGVRHFLLKSLIKTDNAMCWRFNLDAITKNYANIIQGLDGDGCFEGPTLFIKGANSDYIQASHRTAIGQYFPNSKAHVINDAGHWLHVEKPEQFNRIVNRFLLP